MTLIRVRVKLSAEEGVLWGGKVGSHGFVGLLLGLGFTLVSTQSPLPWTQGCLAGLLLSTSVTLSALTSQDTHAEGSAPRSAHSKHSITRDRH